MRLAGKQRNAVALAAALIGLCTAPSFAADRPAWQCVPEEARFVVRLPNVAGFIDALKSRTKLGAVVADEQRWIEIRELVKSEAGDDWEKFTAAFEKLGLTTDELWKS